ncbi:MAG: sulfatase-like hydrolase/transferase [Leptospira sp.]|nr:sulfatase-like hydrolase/transferase [Leptospira sp.]
MFNLKLNNLKHILKSQKYQWILFYLILFSFHFPGELIWSGWTYYHGVFLHILFLIGVILIVLKLLQFNFFVKNFTLLVFMVPLLLVLNYQWVYQTQFNFSLFGYAVQNFGFLWKEFFPFLHEWSMVHYFPFLILILFFDPFLVFTRYRVNPTFLLLVVYLLLLFHSKLYVQTLPTIHQKQNLKQKVNQFINHIPNDTHIVMIVLEGVSRKHLIGVSSKFINFSSLENSHFLIPMPHTSKSLFTWMTGESQIHSSRIQSTKQIEGDSLPSLLKQKYLYETKMIYTQSIYFEGMNLFFPNVFQQVQDKTVLEKKFGNPNSNFSWGMDDRVVLSEFKHLNFGSHPFFILVGLSQTHSPYFTYSNQDVSLPKVLRHTKALEENINLIDELISYLKSNSKRETFLIITADHGESFGEGGAHAHNYSLYNQEIDVPFLMYAIQSNELYIPKLGSSIHFKQTLLDLLQQETNRTKNSQNFFSSNYKLDLVLKTWNSEIQRGLVLDEKKYIFHNDKDILYEMDLDEKNQKMILDQKLKDKLIKKMYEFIQN